MSEQQRLAEITTSTPPPAKDTKPETVGFCICPLCNDPERIEDMVSGVCLPCADVIAWNQNNRRANTVVTLTSCEPHDKVPKRKDES